MDGEPVNVIAVLDNGRLSQAVDRAVAVLERLEQPVRVALYSAGVALVAVGGGYLFRSLFSARRPSNNKGGSNEGQNGS